jgi:hypothetical protein
VAAISPRPPNAHDRWPVISDQISRSLPGPHLAARAMGVVTGSSAAAEDRNDLQKAELVLASTT